MPQVDINTLLGEVLVTQRTGGGASVIDGVTQVPRYPVTPTVNGVACGAVIANSSTGEIECARVVIFTNGEGDDNVAAGWIADCDGDVQFCYPDSDLTRSVSPDGSDGEITDVYILFCGNGGTDAGGDQIIDSSTVKNLNGQLVTTVGTVATQQPSAAEIVAATNMVHLEFESTDKVRHFTMTMGPQMKSTDSKLYATFTGASYA